MMSVFLNALNSKKKSIKQAFAAVDSNQDIEFDLEEDDDDDWD